MKKGNKSLRLPVVAIVGRPNVGKSALFNALLKEKKAVVFDVPGTTRDPVTGVVKGSVPYFLVDTAGLEFGQKGEKSLETDVQMQTRLAMEEADVVMMVVDSKEGVMPGDREVIQGLRKSGKPWVLVANKFEGKVNLYDFLEFGVGEPRAVSALNRLGIRELDEELREVIRGEGWVVDLREIEAEEGGRINLLFAGRPNVGKSSLVNNLVGQEKCLVSEVPGTTRDSTEIEFEYEGVGYKLLDTAGVRRRSKRADMIEHFATMRMLEALYRAEVAFLVVDGGEGPTTQDARVAEELVATGVGVVLVVNKIDLWEEKEQAREVLEGSLRSNFAFLAWAPVVFVSAKTGKNMRVLLEVGKEVAERRRKVRSEDELDKALRAIVTKKPHVNYKGRPVRFRGIEEIKGDKGILFKVGCNHPESVHFSYRRYLENNLRQRFDLTGVPVKFKFERVT